MEQAKSDILQLTDANGRPIDNDNQTLSAGPTGPLLLMDTHFIEKIAHFDRERIPERVVHAKGFGAHGYFEVTKDITKLCKAKLFEKIGKKTPVFARWSTVIGEKGSADTRRDPRGFAVKFYTEEGNWDMVGNNVPIFFVNDPVKFPDLIHSLKRNPQTNLPDANMMWDFLSQTPEATHMVTMLFSDRGIPVGYRHMNGYGTHTFKWVNSQGEVTFVKLHFLTNQGIKTFTAEEGRRLEGEAPEFAAQDFITAINNKEYPSWKLCVQTIPEAEVGNATFNILDPTKVWPHSQYPLTEVGRLVFDRNVENFHAETEQACFSPGTLVPGMEPSNDKLLQGRIFSYPDTQRYRVGPNYQQLPVNCPFATKIANGQRDGPMAFNNQGNRLHYGPSSWGNYHDNKKYQMTMYELHGMMGKHNWNSDSDHFSQPRALFEKVMSETDRQHLFSNIAGNLKGAAKHIKERQCALFFRVHVDYGKGVADLLGLDVNKLQQAAQHLEENEIKSPDAPILPIVHKTVKSEIPTSPRNQNSSSENRIRICAMF